METRSNGPDTHLTEDDLFRLAVPPAGEPEALPSHLLACAECARNLQVWKTAVRDLADEDEAALARRTPEQWETLEDSTLAAIRKSGPPGAERRRRLVWSLGLAASVLVAVNLAIRPAGPANPAASLEDSAELAVEDRADDALLRDIGVLARGEEPGNLWNSLAPVPVNETTEAEDNL